jgi:TRAP-type mannitol/chloroaromatic compound transport system permease large subunit
MAMARKRLNVRPAASQALTTTTKLSCFVVFILVGATMFSLTFQGVDGPQVGGAPADRPARWADWAS